jgi:mRNA interferase MazF
MLRTGDLFLIEVPFHQKRGGRVRPVVVILNTGDDDFVGAAVTSHALRSNEDLAIEDWAEAGLNVPSVVRLHKLATLTKDRIRKPLGRLTSRDWDRLTKQVCRLYCPKGVA